MTDADKIRDAWHSTVRWPEPGNILRMSEPMESAFRVSDGADSYDEVRRIIEFRYEQGTLNGRRASRVMGKLGDTDIEVSISYED